LLQAAHDAGVKRVVHCSSVGVFGEIANPPADETTPCYPTNTYEQTKLAGERIALDFSRQSGLPVVVARPAWVYGPRCPRTHKLFRTIKKRRFVVVGNGQALRHPIYVADAVHGLDLCATVDDAIGEVYILAGSRQVTVEALIQIVAEVLGVPTPKIHVPVAPAKAAALALQLAFKPFGREPPFSRRSVDFFLKDNAYDTGKAQRHLGFYPQIDLHDGLTRTWRCMSLQ
jgi:nucleoside-diphosphate-sugar epimerase